MSIALKRRKANAETEAALIRLQELAREQAERLGPYAEQARDNAALRLTQARGWTAPRLETAAQRVEDTVAPRVADLLNAAAHRVDPKPARRFGRIPRSVIVIGVGALGAAAVYGALRVRRVSQDAEWQENLDSAREQVRETKDQLTAKAKETKGKVKGAAQETASDTKEAKDIAAKGTKESAQELNGRVK
ncbi:ElaB/YqjD/DUF883 family membrane-anchored ribosome-binding protein [Spinactinospora alkalitolerans]|uniref:ElaB/YqjD/DUF883 family membrane-anchored ribosome-binding protein n=1 Tax=Spinactinospora alkalitolerans TaxID=687207 RepID=A0A852U7F4_9ACTN|nr:hypothetical protein [Spinactinospora alkalitolerans]NYE50803.1 ElaB/YqjD/DUF883 family membrane-anchored ribosome-binding protein [Spinactinospora alkalitolerans]